MSHPFWGSVLKCRNGTKVTNKYSLMALSHHLLHLCSNFAFPKQLCTFILPEAIGTAILKMEVQLKNG